MFRKIGSSIGNLKCRVSSEKLLDYLDCMKSYSSDKENLISLDMLFSKIKIQSSQIRYFYEDLKDFLEKNEVKRIASDEMSIDALLGIDDDGLEYEASLENWLLFAYFDEQRELESIDQENFHNDWTPPENWANGTDDEKEAYNDFWRNSKK